MKRFISILTLLATLGFALPTPADARGKDRDRDRGDRDGGPQRSAVVKKKRPVVVSRPTGRFYYSNRSGPVVVHPPVRRHHPRRGLFDFLIRL